MKIGNLQQCESTAFQCKDGTCIPIVWKCDTKNDCKDGSDEFNCGQENHNCNGHQFECLTTNRCVPRAWVCDGDFDCGQFDRSDEDVSLCHTKEKCSPNYSECFSDETKGKCDVTFYWKKETYKTILSTRYYLY